MQRVLVSACLLGQPVRYDGGTVVTEGGILARWQMEGRIVPMCPRWPVACRCRACRRKSTVRVAVLQFCAVPPAWLSITVTT